MVRREKVNYVIQSVSHALDVLEQFCSDADELGVTELSKRLKLHKNNVFRLLATLESRGYIEQNRATENYRLGVQCLHIGRSYAQHMGLLRQARSIMEQLVKQCHESALVAVLRRGGVVPVDTVEANQPVRLASLLGESLPLHCTAVGKAHLAFESEDDLKNSLPEALERYTPTTITDRQALAEQLKAIAAAGYAVDNGEFIADLRSVAAPIRDYTRQLVGSLAISGPAYRISPERIEKEVVPLVVKAGKELSSRLGYNEK